MSALSVITCVRVAVCAHSVPCAAVHDEQQARRPAPRTPHRRPRHGASFILLDRRIASSAAYEPGLKQMLAFVDASEQTRLLLVQQILNPPGCRGVSDDRSSAAAEGL